MKHFLCAFALLSSLAVPTQAGVLHESNVDGWIVGAYSNNRTGQFSHCATSVNYKSGITLFFHLGKNFTWTMGLAHSRWQLVPGSRFDLVYYIDAGPRTRVRANVTNTKLVSIPLADSKALFESFRRGHRLIVEAANETIRFRLTNSSSALAATLQCTQSYVARRPAPSNPFERSPSAAQGAPSEVAAPRDKYRTEATILTANVLSALGIPGFRILPREEIPRSEQRFDAVWAADGGLMGAVNVVPPNVASNVDQVAAALLAFDAQTCNGKFASGRYPPDQTRISRVMTSCSETATSFEVQYTIAPRPGGGYYVLGVTGSGRDSTILDAGKRIHEAALRGFGNR